MVSKADLDYISRIVEECFSENDLTLDLRGRFLGDDGIPALLQCPQLKVIENLDLTKNQISWRGAKQLFICEMPRIKRLYIGENPIGDRGVRFLKESPFASQLVNLDLRYSEIGVIGGTVLAKSDKFRKLQVLILQENEITDATLVALASNKAFSNIRKLNIYKTQVTDLGVKALAKSRGYKKLKHLNLARNVIRKDGALALSQAKFLPSLETLMMFDTFIGDEGTQALLNSKGFTLKTLRLT